MSVKRILAGSEDPQFVQMLIDEARIAAQLSHPNIVQVFELGEHEGAYFISMEYLHGENLSWVVRQGLSAQRPLPITHCVRIIASAAEALSHAHTKKGLNGRPLGIVHRDISPQNIIVTFDGVVKLVDPGIAKAQGRSSRTLDGKVKGKLAYMSPEQARGETVDPQSDVFSLGVVLYEAVTRARFLPEGDDRDIWALIAGEKPFLPARARSSEVPAELDAIVSQALARDKNQRFATARFFHVALEQWLKTQPEAPGSVELETYMRSIFGERIGQRARLLELARSGATPPVDRGPDYTLPDSMPGHTQMTAVSRALRAFTRLTTPRVVGALSLVGVLLAFGVYRLGQGSVMPTADGPQSTVVDVQTSPPGGQLFIDGQAMGTAPQQLDHLAVGPHAVRATLDGYLEARSDFEVRAQKDTLRIALALTPEARVEHESNVTFVEPPPPTEARETKDAKKSPHVQAQGGKLSVDATPWAKVISGHAIVGGDSAARSADAGRASHVAAGQ